MPKTEEIVTYEYRELQGKAAQKATDWLQDIQGDDAVDRVRDMFETELEQRGLSSLKTWWQLSYVQGDGVAFEGHIYLENIEPIQGEEGHGDQAADEQHIAAIKEAAKGFEMGIVVSCRDLRFDVEVEHHCYDYDRCPANDAEAAELATRDAVEEWLKDLAKRFARMGYAEFEYAQSVEALHELAEANEYRFDKTGRPIHHLL